MPKYCTLCGSPMMITCPNGHLVKVGRFCGKCGADLQRPAGLAETAELPAIGAAFAGTRTAGDGNIGIQREQAQAEAAAPTGAEPTALPEPTQHRAHGNRLVIPGVVLLILLIGGGAYFGVSKLTGNSPTHTAVAAAPSADSTGHTAPGITTSPPSANALAPSPAPLSASASASPSASASASPADTAADPGAVVMAYYAAINAGDYRLAWTLGGDNINAGSYDAFVQGFATTASDALTIRSVVNETVTVHLDATQTDGSHHYYSGTYTVHNGVIVKSFIQQSTS